MNRIELYNLVWTKPLSSIEQELNVKIQDIKNTCVKYQIPLPENGHWSKLKYNKQQPTPNLPPLEDKALSDSDNVFELHNKDISPLKRINLKKEEIENDKRINLKVPDRITTLDKIVEQAKQDLTLAYSQRNYQSDDFVFVSKNAFSISVSKEAISRAVRIINTLVVAIQKRGHSFKLGNETEVVIYNEPIQIRLREKREKYRDEKNSYTRYKPTGILYFIIDRWAYEKTYSDSPNQPLEDKISTIIAYLEILGEKKVQETITQKAYWREQEILREQEAKKRQAYKEEQEKIQQLITDSENWRKANNLRAYINALEQNAIQPNTLTEEIQEYIKWARLQADMLDPLKKTSN